MSHASPSQICPFPFAAIVGQDLLKTGLILNVIDPGLAGVLIRGEKGTAKSTAVRALADLLPAIEVLEGCPYQATPAEAERFALPSLGSELIKRPVKVVELPISATEDRVVGSIDLEHAIQEGSKRIEPGILAAAHRGLLYVDEVNLLDDHVVDVLLDAAAMGVNTIEREGISFQHPARFTLIGTMNPEEGELRPQLLDRFGLCVQLGGLHDLNDRVNVIKRRLAYDADPAGFTAGWQSANDELATQIEQARKALPTIDCPDSVLRQIAETCLAAEVDGHRADIVLLRCATALAAWHNKNVVSETEITAASELVLPHRRRRQPFEDVV